MAKKKKPYRTNYHRNNGKQPPQVPPPPGPGLPPDVAYVAQHAHLDLLDKVAKLAAQAFIDRPKSKLEYLRGPFLHAWARLYSPEAACAHLGISLRTPQRWCDTDPLFAEAYHDVERLIDGTLKSTAYRRVLEGDLKPVWYKGEQVGWERNFSDILTVAMLRGRFPEEFNRPKETKVDVSDGLKSLMSQWESLRDVGSSDGAGRLPEAMDVDWEEAPAHFDDVDGDAPGETLPPDGDEGPRFPGDLFSDFPDDAQESPE